MKEFSVYRGPGGELLRGNLLTEGDPETIQVADDDLAHAVEHVVRTLDNLDPILDAIVEAVDVLGQTVVMVTHDPVAASHSDEVVFLADGSVVDRLQSPPADRVAECAQAFRDRGLVGEPVGVLDGTGVLRLRDGRHVEPVFDLAADEVTRLRG